MKRALFTTEQTLATAVKTHKIALQLFLRELNLTIDESNELITNDTLALQITLSSGFSVNATVGQLQLEWLRTKKEFTIQLFMTFITSY